MPYDGNKTIRNNCFTFYLKIVILSFLACKINQIIGKLLKYLAIPILICFCKITSRYTFAKSKMVDFPAVCFNGHKNARKI